MPYFMTTAPWPVLGKGLAVRAFEVVRELLEFVQRLLGAGLARHFRMFFRSDDAQRAFFSSLARSVAVSDFFKIIGSLLQCTVQAHVLLSLQPVTTRIDLAEGK